ncbi:hypothetical protein ABZZ74_46720 [Streptomyces sp. NPDC006476]|uniref:hypothetical protein n=1 Tax=Streptomyces sp. NPDC006476 TaxID=3157175 RepID=UPI0033BF30CF
MDSVERRIHEREGEIGPRLIREFLARKEAEDYAGCKPIGYENRVGWKLYSTDYFQNERCVWLTSRGELLKRDLARPEVGNWYHYWAFVQWSDIPEHLRSSLVKALTKDITVTDLTAPWV